MENKRKRALRLRALRAALPRFQLGLGFLVGIYDL